ILEYQNDFQGAEKIYRKLMEEDNLLAESALANNLADRLLAGYSKDSKADKTALATLVKSYSSNPNRDQLEAIRVKNKMDILDKADKPALANLEKIGEYWIRKDEYAVLKIYLQLRLNLDKDALKTWTDSQALFNQRTHPMTIRELSSLCRKFMGEKVSGLDRMTGAVSGLARTPEEVQGAASLPIELLIKSNLLAEAVPALAEFEKKYPKAQQKPFLRIDLAEAFLKAGKTKDAKRAAAGVAVTDIASQDLKSRFNFVNAEILGSEGKLKEAGALYLRVGQTSKKETMIIESLYRSGVAFQKSSNCKNAVIAFNLLLTKKQHKYTDMGRFNLVRSYADCKDFSNAVKSIDILVKTAKAESAQLKKEALFLKGGYYLAQKKIKEAIKAYEDYTVVYDKDSRNPDVLFNVYKIYRGNLRDLKKAHDTLQVIIKKWRDISPEVYSAALFHSAVINNLNGSSRETIILLQQFLEFNKKTGGEKNNDAKLLLAAAYQNSSTLDSSAAVSLYTDVLSSSKRKPILKTALLNLLNLEVPAAAGRTEAEISRILKTGGSLLDAETCSMIMNWKAVRLKKMKSADKEKYINLLLNEAENIDFGGEKNYWKAYFLYQRGLLKSKEADFKPALSLLDTLEGYRAGILRKNLQSELKMEEQALSSSLKIIYSYISEIEQDDYSDWKYFHDACLSACDILIARKQYKLAEKLINRLKGSSLSGTDKIIAVLAKKLEGAEK
ncbi:MAG: tetratricopeptide repeat protein, partial [Planctomycetota bacterium]